MNIQDKEIKKLISKELDRQKFGLEMIPSENYVSESILETMGTVLTNKYSEGYSGKRYYGGNEFIDEIENLAIKRAKKVFDVEHVNVQPYSGSIANFAVLCAICKIGDTIMGQSLPDGGHLTHGWKASMTGQFWNSIQYHVNKDGKIDLSEVKELAEENKPKLIWIGSTAYVYKFPFREFSKIADDIGAFLVADISHISGLVATGVHESPSLYAHIVTSTTHKTLRGPRGAMIMITKKGIKKDLELPKKIDKTIFPGLQGGPHDNTTAAIASALYESLQPEFKVYCEQIVQNSKALVKSLIKNGIKCVGNTSENHMVLIDLTPFGKGKGLFVQDALDEAGITVNKNTIPNESSSAFYPSGIRLGTSTLTTRGMKENEMEYIAKWISEIIKSVIHYELPNNKEERKEVIGNFRKEIKNNQVIKNIRNDVSELCKEFSLYENL